MTAGFPTDDPWGDRQQGLPLTDFASLLASQVRFNWAPCTRFEYSNLGYAILGMVITGAAGVPYDEFITGRLLTPLGMARTGFEAADFAAADVALGYRRGMNGWEQVPFDPYGAFAPMGGIFTCVADLAIWVAGFTAAFPSGGGVATHPLRAASRRQMQLPQAVTGWRTADRIPGGPPAAPAYYGFGLFTDEDQGFGRVVSHSGGYPGFGSNMRWHPATGLGVIALGNATYAPMSVLTSLLLDALLPRSAAYHVALTPAGAPWPETLAATAAVNELVATWDDDAADALFTENVALDAPYRERQHAIGLIRERIGEFGADAQRAPESDTPAHRRWWLTGPGGTVQAQLLLTPENPPRVQALTLAIPPAAGSPLALTLDSLLAWLNAGAVDWPATVVIAEGTDAGLLARRLRMAAAWAGRVRPGVYRTGDGNAALSIDLVGEHATVTLALVINPGTGELRQADISL
jgi:CubicO group peptidase (beta-lactamase class C family)